MCIRKTFSRTTVAVVPTNAKTDYHYYNDSRNICETSFFFCFFFFFFLGPSQRRSPIFIGSACTRLNRKCKPIGIHACFHRNTFRNQDNVFFFFANFLFLSTSPCPQRHFSSLILIIFSHEKIITHVYRTSYNIPLCDVTTTMYRYCVRVRTFKNNDGVDDGVLYVRSPKTHILLPFLGITHF